MTAASDRVSERPEDMSQDGRLRLIWDTDGDMTVCVREEGMAPYASVEFCNSGGHSPRTLAALRELFAAMEADNDAAVGEALNAAASRRYGDSMNFNAPSSPAASDTPSGALRALLARMIALDAGPEGAGGRWSDARKRARELLAMPPDPDAEHEAAGAPSLDDVYRFAGDIAPEDLRLGARVMASMLSAWCGDRATSCNIPGGWKVWDACAAEARRLAGEPLPAIQHQSFGDGPRIMGHIAPGETLVVTRDPAPGSVPPIPEPSLRRCDCVEDGEEVCCDCPEVGDVR